MKTRIIIQTPKGQAKKTEKRLRKFILGRKESHKTMVNKLDNKIIWEVEGTPREIQKINKNVCKFDLIMKKILNSKMLKKAVRNKFSKEQEQELREMLQNQTKVEIIKEATAEEILKNKSMWERLKEGFQQKNK